MMNLDENTSVDLIKSENIIRKFEVLHIFNQEIIDE